MCVLRSGFLVASLTLGVLAEKVVQLDIQGTHPNEALKKLRKRASINSYLLNDNAEGLYSINVTIGTPGQPFQLQLDTGSTDVWVNSYDSQYCQAGNCYDSYNSGKSSSYEEALQGGFEVLYGDGTGAEGDYITDVLGVGGVSISKQTIGLAKQSNISYGLMGVGFAGTEGDCGEGGYCYPTVIDEMVSQGKINSHAFSLFLNDLDQSTGSILFGGVDSSRYTGDLVQIPMIGIPLNNGSFETDRYTVALSNITITTPKGVENLFPDWTNGNIPALLDSGTSQALFPQEIVSVLNQQFGAVTVEGTAYCPCYLRTSNATVDFHLGGTDGAILKVPIREFIVNISSRLATIWHDIGGAEYCEVGFYAGDSYPILGDTILRSAYIVYDLDNKQIAIAQANFNPGSPSVKEITNGTTSNIPGVKRTASAVTNVSTYSATAGPIGPNTVVVSSGAASATSTITAASIVPLAAFTTAKYTGQGGYTIYTAITTGASTATGSSSTSSGAANAIVVPRIGFEGITVMGLVSLFMAMGAGIFFL